MATEAKLPAEVFEMLSREYDQPPVDDGFQLLPVEGTGSPVQEQAGAPPAAGVGRSTFAGSPFSNAAGSISVAGRDLPSKPRDPVDEMFSNLTD